MDDGWYTETTEWWQQLTAKGGVGIAGSAKQWGPKYNKLLWQQKSMKMKTTM